MLSLGLEAFPIETGCFPWDWRLSLGLDAILSLGLEAFLRVWRLSLMMGGFPWDLEDFLWECRLSLTAFPRDCKLFLNRFFFPGTKGLLYEMMTILRSLRLSLGPGHYTQELETTIGAEDYLKKLD